MTTHPSSRTSEVRIELHPSAQVADAASRRGFALPFAIGTLVIVAALITAGAYMARNEFRIGFAGKQGLEGFYLAETGVARVLAGGDTLDYLSLTEGQTLTRADTADHGLWTVDVTHFANRIFLLDGTGTVTRGGTELSGATRRVGVLARLRGGSLGPPAAMITRSPVTLKGKGTVSGLDRDPPSWTGAQCPGPTSDATGVLSQDQSEVSVQGGMAVLEGAPPKREDEAIDDSTFTSFDGIAWSELVAMADKVIGSTSVRPGPSLSGGLCDVSDPLNWGDPDDPLAPCGGYFPIVHLTHPNSVTLAAGSRGQGLLLVDSDLRLSGGVTFVGVIIVQGHLEASGLGNKVFGTVWSSNSAAQDQDLSGQTEIQYSACANRAVAEGLGLPRFEPIDERNWVDLSYLR